MTILGISAFYHDSAAALVRDGQLVAAAQEERFTRKKHDFSFPIHAARFCLTQAGLEPNDLDAVAYYEKPFVKFERILLTYLGTFPRSFHSYTKAMPLWLKQKLWIPHLIRKELDYDGPIYFTEHHQSHAAAAFLVSPFEEAAILTLDGVGEWATATMGTGRGSRIKIHKEIHFPHSLGLFYSALTYYLGFRVNSAEYKVMGLAPYGEPELLDKMRELIRFEPDGGFALNMRYFSFDYGLTMTNRHFEHLFGQPRRRPEEELTDFHKAVAASGQKMLEEVMLNAARALKTETGQKRVCLAGGVALNSVANGRLLREGIFEELFIQPAASDAGSAAGAAFFVANQLLGEPRRFEMTHAYWGTPEETGKTRAFLKQNAIPCTELSEPELLKQTARLLAEGKIVGWFQGRSEFGPRALGNRSILADPRRAEMKDTINARVKFREAFRPFAPSVLEEKARDYFDLDRPSPFMLLVARVKQPEAIPAVTHVDGTARLQTVSEKQNPRYYRLLQAFENQTGVPVLLNTSFNVRGEPIVDTPKEAFACFMRTGLDALVLGNFLLLKPDMPPIESFDFLNQPFVLEED
ncbi:MAG: carbamoyltransferase [Calditrichaeota bacterium]|nr:carbamoyltransferase [Calditrichota bacterium]